MNFKRFALLAAGVAFFAASPAWATLGDHAINATNPCKVCHDTAKGTATLRGWAGGSVPSVAGTGWAGRTLSALCYMCHTSGNAVGATNQTPNAFAAAAHGNTVTDMPDLPDTGTFTADTVMASSNLPYVTKANLECTSCHNVHKSEDKPFIQRATVATLCQACHGGRANATPVRGTNNNAATGGHSTHPTAVTYSTSGNTNIILKTLADPGTAYGVNVPYTATGQYELGGHLTNGSATAGVMDCGTCHAVHGTRQGATAVSDLLALPNTTGATGSALCNYCHSGGVGVATFVGTDGNDHPIDDNTGAAFYPTGVAVPATWAGQRNGATASPQGFYAGTTNTPACSTCHDMHGGHAGTPLLQKGTESATYTSGWCWVCHTAAQIAPQGHHSNTLNWASSQLVCGDCHGAATTGSVWSAHNGFWSFATAISSTNSDFCEGCHTPTDPTFLIAAGLKGNKALTSTAAGYPSKHGAERSPYASSQAGSSHQVDLAANATNPNLVKKTTAWASSAGISEWGTGTNEPICESCHNILVNGTGTATDTATSGWQGNLLLQPYEDDTMGIAGTGATVGDALCRGCHTNGGDGFVHNPEAHTVAGYAYVSSNVPYGRATLTVMTGGTCPNATTADATSAPNTLSYPAANSVNCDSCHRPHNADADSLDGNRYLILETTAANAWGTTICAECHNTDTQCQ